MQLWQTIVDFFRNTGNFILSVFLWVVLVPISVIGIVLLVLAAFILVFLIMGVCILGVALFFILAIPLFLSLQLEEWIKNGK